jgi:tetratricopeptide (TPR) repeat protein
VAEIPPSVSGGSLLPAVSAPEAVGLETERMRDVIAQRLFDAPATPPKIGRFVVIDAIGRGGMGTVVSAWDPQLDRRVAVKVLHGRPGETDRERLLVEAKALARLNHPNVVTVYEAGLSEGRVYMAMEYVEGGTLRDACRDVPLAQRGADRRVHAMFVDAARGLAAAHRVGLVHRDVKPTNMLIDGDGRLRLADFGLARADVPITRDGEGDTASGRTRATAALDHTGWVGTPAYMAPEQFDGHADELSDQFNLCASFWEVVHGKPPYAGTTLSETCGNVIEGRLQSPAPESAVPQWLRRILLRGISIDPRARFPDIGALLRELEAKRASKRARWIGAGAIVALGLVAIAIARGQDAEDVTARCMAETEARAPAFGADERTGIADAFRATGATFAEAAWDQVELELDGWHARWREADTQACRGQADADGTLAREATRRRACLERAATAFASLTETLGHADRETLPRASLAAHALPPPERCTEEGVERVLDDPSPKLAAAAEDIARAATDRGLRRIDDAEERLENTLATLGDEDASVRTYVRQELATLAHLRADHDASLEQVRGALADAELAGDAEAQVQCWRVMSLAHARKGEAEAALFAVERMDSLARRADVSLSTRARAEWGGATTFIALKRYTDSLPRFERALSRYENELRTTLGIASLRCEYSDVLFVLEHVDAAIEQSRLCRDAHIEGRGENHPFVALAWLQLSQYAQWAGDLEDAIAASDAAREILEANPWFSPAHRAMAYKLRGDAYYKLGRHETALADLEEAVRLASEAQGPDGLDVALARTDLALVLRELGREGEARAALEATVESASRNPRILGSAKGTPRLNLALLLSENAEPEAALEHLQQARATLDETRPTSSSLSPTYWTTVARVYRLCARLPEARDALDRALASIESARVQAAPRGKVLAEDAILLHAAGEQARADARLEEARVVLREAGEAGKEALAELEAWAAARAPSP